MQRYRDAEVKHTGMQGYWDSGTQGSRMQGCRDVGIQGSRMQGCWDTKIKDRDHGHRDGSGRFGSHMLFHLEQQESLATALW